MDVEDRMVIAQAALGSCLQRGNFTDAQDTANFLMAMAVEASKLLVLLGGREYASTVFSDISEMLLDKEALPDEALPTIKVQQAESQTTH